MAVRLATLLAAAAQEPHVPDPEVGRIVDAVAAQFVAAGGRGFEGWEPKRLKEAARAWPTRASRRWRCRGAAARTRPTRSCGRRRRRASRTSRTGPGATATRTGRSR